MPGESWEDFEVGQWVGIAFDCEFKRRVGKIVAIQIKPDATNPSFHVAFYDSEGNLIPGHAETHKLHHSSSSWGDPSSLYTAYETEEILYHCSYCGTEGHNRRTCPKLEGTEHVSAKGEKVEYRRGEEVNLHELNKGDLVKVEYKPEPTSYPEYSKGTYEVTSTDGHNCFTKVVDNAGEKSLGSFGHPLTFGSGTWTYFSVEEVGGTEAIKKLPIWSLIELVLPASRLTLLYGPPGTGKTTAGNYMGEPKEVYNLTLTEETPAAELRGHFIPKGQEFVWMDGPALTAFKRGARLVLNEIDKASGDALTFCHALLDDPGIARITLPYKSEEGETVTVTPHPDFHVVATMNGEPDDLPEALRDRFAVRINVDKVHPDAIASLPKELRKIASKGISKDGERSVSIRGWNAFVQLREIVGEENAARAVFGSRADTILNTIKIDGLATGKKGA